MANEKKLSLKVLVDNQKKRVVFAEASSDFVDVLFSFLTLPLGTIIKLLSKKSGLGSIDNLYGSIEQLDDQHFLTVACKNMLLSSCNAAAEYCEDLKLNLYGPREFYFCKMDECISRSTCYYSSVWETRCHYCGKFMDKVGRWGKDETTENDGVFLKRNSIKFMITDDLHVTPSSLLPFYDLLKDFGVKNMDLLEEKSLEFGKDELLHLFKESLNGKEVFTNICFPDWCIRCTTPICNNGIEIKKIITKGNTELETQKMQIKLIMNKINSKVVCAEVGEDFVDQLFSFLTFPLGSVLNFIGCFNSLGCMSKKYSRIEIGLLRVRGGKDYADITTTCSVFWIQQTNVKYHLLSVTQILRKQGLHVDHLVKKEMTIGRAQVIDLLRAMLISKTSLSDALFLHDKRPSEITFYYFEGIFSKSICLVPFLLIQ